VPRASESGGRMLLLVLVLSLLAAPAEYVAHESGHHLMARFFGADATLHFDRVTLAPGTDLSRMQRLLFVAAGPAVDAVVGLVGLFFLIRRYSPVALVFAIWLARPLQFLPQLLGLDIPAFALADGLAGTDEGQIAAALGVSPLAFIWAEMAVVAPLLALIVLRLPSTRRLAILSVLSIGVLVGWASWLAWGPYVLP
jgi:hypothetical protein